MVRIVYNVTINNYIIFMYILVQSNGYFINILNLYFNHIFLYNTYIYSEKIYNYMIYANIY